MVILSIASLGPLLYMHQSWLLQSRNFAEIVNYLSVIREESAEAHLWAEELITGDTGEDIEEIRHHFVTAQEAAARFEKELPEKVPEIQFYMIDQIAIIDHATSLKVDLVTLEEKANDRLSHRSTSGAGTASDISFDAVYHRALDKTRNMERVIRTEQAEVAQQNLQKHWTTLLLWLVTLSGTLLFVSLIRARQRRAEERLEPRRNRH